MSKLKPILRKLEQMVVDLEKPVTSQLQMFLEDVIPVFAAVVWLGGMTLIRL